MTVSIVRVNNKLFKIFMFSSTKLSSTKLSYELMVVIALTSETAFDGLLNYVGQIPCLVGYRIRIFRILTMEIPRGSI